MFNSANDGMWHFIDSLSLGVLVATWLEILPKLAALLTVIWTIIRIYESVTVQNLIAKIKRSISK